MDGPLETSASIPTNLPTEIFERLLPALVDVLRAAQTPEAITRAEQKLALTSTTTQLKELVSRARLLIAELPGGEMLLEDQDAVIKALEELRDTKSRFLSGFAELERSSVNDQTKLEGPSS